MKMRNILALAAIALITAGCFQGNESEIGPQETLEAFYRSICSGDFDGAGNLCHKPEMDGYLENFRTTWEKTDSTVAAMASDILSEMVIEVSDENDSGEKSSIFYKLTTSDGQSKEKVATLRKEEGTWKIEAITDKR
jgi:hypothetical protein